MLSNHELDERIQELYRMCFPTFSKLAKYKDKALVKFVTVIRNAKRHQFLARDPTIIVMCAVRILFLYDKKFVTTALICEWKRQRKLKLANECYFGLMQMYLPEKTQGFIEGVLNVIDQDQLWKCESFSFKLVRTLLQYSDNGVIIIHAICDRIELSKTHLEDKRAIIKIFYKLLDVYNWPETQETVTVIERILNLFYISITYAQPSTNGIAYGIFKKGLEISIRKLITRISNDHLLIIIQYMCSWAIEEGMPDDIILQFGCTLEYTAYIHKVVLYENTLTPKIFPLLMKMIASRSKITNLLGHRVIHHLLDRKNNKSAFDTPKIFFEDTDFDLKIEQCFKEDKLFCKIHREYLHDSLIKSIFNHCDCRMNLEASYCTICIIATEVPCGFTAAALVCFAMNLQDIALKKFKGYHEAACHIHATVIAVISLLCWIHKAKAFYIYVNKIIIERAQWAPHLNPPIQSHYPIAMHHILWAKPGLFFVDWEVRYGLWKCFRLRE